MKLKFKQSVYVVAEGRIIGAKEEIEIADEVQAQSFIDANYAEAVVEQKPSKQVVQETVEPVEKPKRPRKAKDGDK